AQALLVRGVEASIFSTEPAGHPRAKWASGRGIPYMTAIPEGARFDLIVEACGSAVAVFAAMESLAPLGVVAVLGATKALGAMPFDQMLVNDQAMFGSVNAAPSHYHDAVRDLGRMDAGALRAMIERRRFVDYGESFSGTPSAAAKVVHT